MNYKIIIILLLSMNTSFAKEWAFKADVDGKDLGTHVFTLTENKTEKTLKSEARFIFKIMFFTAYDYDHVAEEKWQNDCLISLNSKTKENSEKTEVEGKVVDQKFVTTTKKGKEVLSQCVMTFAYWNPKILTQTQLLNPQNGEYLDVKITSLGKEKINVRGVDTESEHYKIEAKKMDIELWYSLSPKPEDREWLALKSKTPEGRVITYKLR